MGRNLSPVLRRELANLEKDAGTRKSAMKALKSYVKDLNSNEIRLFLAHVSETEDAGSPSVEHTISLYEVLARVHGPNIVSQIDNIMATIIKTLTTSGGSFPLQQACSKVVPAIARYGIEPTTPEEKKREIIHSLCKPLSDSLLVTQESLSCGAALCLKALVDCDNWRFASDEMVNEVCLRLAGALEEKPTQTNSHMGLVMSLAKNNSVIIEPYARLLVQCGLRILDYGGANERYSQKRLTAIHMINFLMKWLDVRSIFSELESIIEEMEKCLSDQMRYVGGAAYEALQTARRLAEKGPRCDTAVNSVTGSNIGRSNGSRRRCLSSDGDRSRASASPESQTLDSFGKYGSLSNSPISMSPVSCHLNRNRRNVNRKLWSYENGGVDISLKDGLFSEVVHGSAISDAFSEHDQASDNILRGHNNGFAGFFSGRSENRRSQSQSPQRTYSQINVDSIKIFTTPRKLVRSLQETDADSNYTENQARRCRSPRSGIEQFHSDIESVSSTEDLPAKADEHVSSELPPGSKNEDPKLVKIFRRNAAANILGAIFLGIFAVFVSTLWWLDVGEEGFDLVPT
ncbi:hypothetical protein Nepgr_030229 [Nepenthes gracilis]|uniref:TORTIFOLIA1/SINE1-2 N-terminal domain-containing protein n=1 Tax=Nepenthes gracilis TaxID=150966 RepID=A0AAD3TGC0_NEPGR|nr:hypothetical protein Nepgr_030229 [Nepenthes gracilis]